MYYGLQEPMFLSYLNDVQNQFEQLFSKHGLKLQGDWKEVCNFIIRNLRRLLLLIKSQYICRNCYDCVKS